MSTEDTGLHVGAQRPQGRDHGVDERFGDRARAGWLYERSLPFAEMDSWCFMYSPSSGYRRMATICEFEVFIAECRKVKL